MRVYTEEEVEKLQGQLDGIVKQVKVVDTPEGQVLEKTDSETPFLENLIKFGHIVKEIQITDGFTVVMKTLSEKEKQIAWSFLTDKDLGENTMVRAEMINLPLIAFALKSINNIKFETIKEKLVLLSALEKFPTTVMDILELKYRELLLEQAKILKDGLKKN